MSRKLIAILRGLQPDLAVETGRAIAEAGINWIEVPLNSPQPLVSIAALQKELGGEVNIGAGTVLTATNVEDVAATGATFVVSPNCNPDVIRRTKKLGMGSFPGVFSPSECFAALGAGADALKIFPAGMMGQNGLKAIKAVLPANTDIYCVGGVGPEDFASWKMAGAVGFGLGSSLFQPDWSVERIAEQAIQSVRAYDSVYGVAQ